MEKPTNAASGSAFFETMPIGRLMIKFGIPAIVSMLVNSLYNIVDQIFIGQGVGYIGNAATNVCFPFVTFSLALTLLISDGGVACYSLMLGEGRRERAERTLGTALLLSAILGTALFALGEAFIPQLLPVFGATSESYPYALSYGRITLIGVPFVAVSTCISAVIRADGRPTYAMLCMVAGAVTNVVLDAWFVLGLGWGVEGAAWATIIGQILNFVLALFGLPGLRNAKVTRASLRLEGDIVRRIAALGFSSFVTQSAATLVVILMNLLLVKYGEPTRYGPDIPMAAFGIVMKANQVVFSIMLGIGIGSQPIEGYNYGARNYRRVRQTYVRSIVVALITGVLGWAAFQFCTMPIIAIFGNEEALYNEFAVKCFRTFLMLLCVSGMTPVSGIFFQAIGKPVKAMLISLSRQVLFFIPCLFLLTGIFGLDGALYTGPCADLLALLFTAVLVALEMRELNGLILRQEAGEGTPLPEA